MATPQARVWLITGATSGFGRAIAEAALAAGDTVVAAARRPDGVADLVESHPDRVTALELDVTDADRIAAAVDEVLRSEEHTSELQSLNDQSRKAG